MAHPSLRAGALIGGRYELLRLLGEGGMAIVWEARHVVTKREVALKFLREALREKEQLRQRFHMEASAATALRHPHVVEILDVFDYAPEAPVMVMELLHGETLGAKLERDEKLSLEETAALLVPVISAVGAAHAQGIVHRDLKPENIFLAQTPLGLQVKVLDFGIAKVAPSESSHGRGPSTAAGSMLGTPCYMAPEQATGKADVDHRADIWSLGVVLYECLSGTRPIEGDDLVQVVSRLVSAGIMPLERIAPDLPHEVSATVMQMLQRDPERRPRDLLEVSRLFASYTRAPFPAFGPASTGKAWAPAPEEIRQARVVQSRGADPRGATLLSAGPTPSSVTVPGSDERQRPHPSGRRALWAGLGVLAVAGVGLYAFRAAQSSAVDAPAPSAQLGLSPAVATGALPRNPGSAAAMPSATTAASAPAPAAPAESAAPPAPAPPVTRVHPPHLAAKARASPAPDAKEAAAADVTKRSTASTPPVRDESLLFHGRK
jgi:serine/threonine-protein kinase